MSILPILAALLVSSPSPTIPVALLVLNDGEGRSYTAAIVERGTGKERSRTLNIVCSSGCTKESVLVSSFDDEPLGLFRLMDANNVVYFTSSSGSSYQIRAYELTPSRITKILDVSSLGAPEVKTQDGLETVRITRRVSQKLLRITSDTYVWKAEGRTREFVRLVAAKAR